MSITTLLKFNFRYYRRHALLSLLCLLGISLGVGVVVAVELINDSALESLAQSVDLLSGKATHSIVSGYGRIEERLFAEVWKNRLIQSASPIVEAMADTLETGDQPVRFIGIDPFLDAQFGRLTLIGDMTGQLKKFVAGKIPSAYLSQELIQKYHLPIGGTLTVLTAGIEKKVRILGNIPAPTEKSVGENMAVMDISSAQEVFGRQGYLDRIDIISKANAADLASSLPASLRLTDANSRKSALDAMLYSFQLNLAAMSLLALFVGIFLIYNFSMFSVLSRREDMSLLLTLGADRRGLISAFLAESLLFGAAGSLIGIGFGFLVAWLSIDKVSSTISELYFYLKVQEVHLTNQVVLGGLGIGFLATLLGTGLPTLEVAVTPPVLGIKRQSIEDRAHNLKGLLLAAGIACFSAALAAAWASRFSIFWGFISAFGMTLAFALFTPSILSPFTHYGGACLRRVLGSLEGFLAARTIRASLSRTSIAVAALAVALSMTMGVDTMIYSFRNSVSQWLDGSLEGDLYISPATTKWDHPLPESLIAALKADPKVEAVERYSTYDIYLDGKPVKLRVVDGSVLEHHTRFQFLKGGKGAWTALKAGGVFVSESLSYHFGKHVGQSVQLTTPKGKSRFPIVSVVRDYSSDQGTIHIDRSVYERIWKDHRVQSVALFLKPGVSADAVRGSIVASFPGLDRTISSNHKMKKDILTIFDKTFATTATLKGVSLLVALLGVATALMVILMERARELTVLGYLGLTPAEMGKMNVFQAVIMALAAFLISVVCGLILTYILIYAINYRSFGWSVDVHVNPWVFVKTAILTAIASLAAAFYPTYRLYRTRAVETLHEE
jgi:putative ABC transport system permease protein